MSVDLNVNDAPAAETRSRYFESYQLARADAEAVPASELIQAPTDVDNLTATVINRLDVIAELDADAALLPKFGLYDYQQLPIRVMALAHAEKEYKIAVAPPPALDGQRDELTHVRKYLLAHGEVLVLGGHISAAPIEALKFNGPQRQMASNTSSVALYFINNWAKIAPHTTMKLDELYEYERKADAVHSAVCVREDQPKQIEKAALIRRQLFTLVFRSLRQVERAALYYYEEKADRYMPRVFAHLGRRGPRAPDPEVTAPMATSPAEAPTPPAAVPAAAPIPPGMPGAHPYMR